MHDPEGVFADGRARTWAALDAMDDLFYVFDTDQRLVAWNVSFADVTGYTGAELLGKAPTDFVRPADRDELQGYLDRIGETGSGTVQVELFTKNGRTIPYEFYSDGLTDEEGEILGRVGVGRNITERVGYQRALERENQRLDEFASTLTHDLRNPLNVAQGRLHMLADGLHGEENSHHIDAISDAHDRIERIISDVLELARTANLVAEQESVDLAALAQEVWNDVEYGRSQLTLETDMMVLADASLLERVLSNLLRNTLEHGGDNVNVRLGSMGDASGFYVADDGPGIPSDERERVFDWMHSTKEGGFGIGLQSIQRICDAHGWDISVTESDEGGARFEITGMTMAA